MGRLSYMFWDSLLVARRQTRELPTMEFHEREYDLYAVLGDPETGPLWRWSEWSEATRILTPIVQTARGKPAVRTTQLTGNHRRQIPFGRLGWDENSHQKWTHSSPRSGSASSAWWFLSLEVWVPSWTTCAREKTAPDVFLNVVNEASDAGAVRELAFNPVLILASSVELASETRTAARTAASELTALMNAKLAVMKRRPWGRPFGGGGFTEAIQDLAVAGLFKVGDRHQRPVDLSTFAEPWELLQVK